MKNKIGLLVAALMMIVGLSGCDDDEKMAFNLSGEWHGYFGTSYSISNRHGKEQVFYSDETYLKFVPDYPFATHGYGIEVDYYYDGPYEYQYFHFDWEIRDERLELSYPHNHAMNAVIDDYKMNSYRFRGYCGGEYFSLHRVDDDYDWECYHDDYGYIRRSSW